MHYAPFYMSSAVGRSLVEADSAVLPSNLAYIPQLTAVVIKFAGNILKGFATALALISTSLISIPMLGFSPAALFWVGLVAVILSTFMCAHLLTARARRVMRTPRASNRRIPLCAMARAVAPLMRASRVPCFAFHRYSTSPFTQLIARLLKPPEHSGAEELDDAETLQAKVTHRRLTMHSLHRWSSPSELL